MKLSLVLCSLAVSLSGVDLPTLPQARPVVQVATLQLTVGRVLFVKDGATLQSTNRLRLPFSSNLLSKLPALPKPGVYQTHPAASLLVVPRPQADDRCIIPVPDSFGSMPVIRPELRLSPRGEGTVNR